MRNHSESHPIQQGQQETAAEDLTTTTTQEASPSSTSSSNVGQHTRTSTASPVLESASVSNSIPMSPPIPTSTSTPSTSSLGDWNNKGVEWLDQGNLLTALHCFRQALEQATMHASHNLNDDIFFSPTTEVNVPISPPPLILGLAQQDLNYPTLNRNNTDNIRINAPRIKPIFARAFTIRLGGANGNTDHHHIGGDVDETETNTTMEIEDNVHHSTTNPVLSSEMTAAPALPWTEQHQTIHLAIVIFNMAIVYHISGIHQEEDYSTINENHDSTTTTTTTTTTTSYDDRRRSSLGQCLRLYHNSWKLLCERGVLRTSLSSSIGATGNAILDLLSMAILNNLALVYHDLSDYDSSQRCYVHMMAHLATTPPSVSSSSSTTRTSSSLISPFYAEFEISPGDTTDNISTNTNDSTSSRTSYFVKERINLFFNALIFGTSRLAPAA